MKPTREEIIAATGSPAAFDGNNDLVWLKNASQLEALAMHWYKAGMMRAAEVCENTEGVGAYYECAEAIKAEAEKLDAS